jgi:hypothetical protein
MFCVVIPKQPNTKPSLFLFMLGHFDTKLIKKNKNLSCSNGHTLYIVAMNIPGRKLFALLQCVVSLLDAHLITTFAILLPPIHK